MSRYYTGVFVLAAVAVLMTAAGAQSITITGPNRVAVIEGQTYDLTWSASGVDRVEVVAFGTLTPLGTQARGDFRIPIADSLPASAGVVSWTVPWIDSISFFVKIKGMDSAGNEVTSAQRGYGFRPAVLARRYADGIYLDLHKRTNQRLYVQKGGRLVKEYFSSSSEAYYWLPRNRHIPDPHDHAGVYHVLSKEPLHESILFQVPMRWAMRYSGGHFIHATFPNLYPYLGQAASHGCNRMTLEDAKELYDSTPVGTRVEIIGPSG